MSSESYSTLNIILRLDTYPTYYQELDPQILIDVNLFRIASLFFSTLIAILIILPGFNGNKKFSILLRWSSSLIILFSIIYCNFMPYWEYGMVKTKMPYRFGSNLNIEASLGLNVGLRGINVTLRGDPIQQHNDTIDFNEYFDWTWSQGKPGFGYDAGQFHKKYREAQFRGLPYPILWVAETFTIDYELIHIGRYYRQSGWLAHIFLWTAVPLFILANILFQMVIYYGSLFIIFTGISLLSANVVMIYLRNSIPLALAFENEFLVTHYSWCFHINLINGVVCIIIGIITLVADLRLPDETAEFFGNDVLQSYEDYFADPQENNQIDEFSNILSKSDNEVLLRKRPANNKNVAETTITSALKKRTFSDRFSRFQKSTIRKTAHSIRKVDVDENIAGKKMKKPDDIPLYENFHQFSTIGEEEKEECENEM